MKCPHCQHVNLSEFPFCEQCLNLLPGEDAESGSRLFRQDIMVTGDDDARTSSVAWPAFPWNPPKLKDPLVGRGYAVDDLVAAWQQVVSTWEGRIHLLLSEPGLGKARAASLFVDEALKVDSTTWIVRCRCPHYGGAFRLWDLILRTALAMPSNADDVEAGFQLMQACRDHVPGQAAEVAALIANLTGWDVPGRQIAFKELEREAVVSRGTSAVATLLSAMCLERPLLIVIDHADRASQSLVVAGALEAMLKNRPFMLLLAGAPELGSILPGWERFPRTQLGSLLPEDSEALFRLFLAGLDEPPVALVDEVVAKTMGSPHAIKSTVRYLREIGAIVQKDDTFAIAQDVLEGLVLPEDLEGMVLARIAHLPLDDRDILGYAGIVGHVFWLGSVVALERHGTGQSGAPGKTVNDGRVRTIQKQLNSLVRRGFLEHRTSTIPGEEAFAFKSEAQFDAARNLLPIVKRRKGHGIVEQWLLLQVAHEPDPYYEELATHAELAGGEGRAAGYLLEAARSAGRRKHPAQERTLLLSARALASPSDLICHLAIQMEVGDAMARVGDQDLALECYQEALHIAWQMRHRSRGAQALLSIGRVETERGGYEEAYHHFLHALQLFEAVEDERGIADTCRGLGRMFWLKGQFEEALQSYDKAQTLFDGLNDTVGLANTLHAMAAVYSARGDLADADETYARSLALRRELNDARGIAASLNDRGVVWLNMGRSEEAFQAWSEARTTAAELGERSIEASLCDSMGCGYLVAGQPKEAFDVLSDGVVIARAIDNPRVLTHALVNQGRAAVALDRWEEAERLLGEAREHSSALGLTLIQGIVERGFGDLLRAQAGEPKAGSQDKKKATTKRSKKAGTKGTKKGAKKGASKKGKKAPASADRAKPVTLPAKVDEAIQAYTRAIALFDAAGYDEESAFTHDRIADLYKGWDDALAADQQLLDALALRQKHRQG